MKKVNSDLIGGAIVVGLALFFHFVKDEYTRFASVFPDAIIPTVAVLGVAILIKAFVKPDYVDTAAFRVNATMFLTIVVAFVWVFFLRRAGFMTSGFLAMTFLLLVFSRNFSVGNIARCAAISAAEIGLVYLIFGKLLNVSFPSGLFL